MWYGNAILCPKLVDQLATIFRVEEEEEEEEGALVSRICRDPICGHLAPGTRDARVSALVSACSSSCDFPRKVAACGIVFTR